MLSNLERRVAMLEAAGGDDHSRLTDVELRHRIGTLTLRLLDGIGCPPALVALLGRMVDGTATHGDESFYSAFGKPMTEYLRRELDDPQVPLAAADVNRWFTETCTRVGWMPRAKETCDAVA